MILELRFLANSLLSNIDVMSRAANFSKSQRTMNLTIGTSNMINIFSPVLIKRVSNILFDRKMSILNISRKSNMQVLKYMLNNRVHYSNIIKMMSLGIRALFLKMLHDRIFRLTFSFGLKIRSNSLNTTKTKQQSTYSRRTGNRRHYGGDNTDLLPEERLTRFPVPFCPLFARRPYPVE